MAGADHRVRAPIVARLLLATLPATVLTFAAFGLAAHWLAQRALEDELGRRLMAVAEAAALSVRGERVDLLAPGDEGSRTYRNVRRKLDELRRATGSARIYVFDEARTSRADSDEMPIGARYYALDADDAEIRRALGGAPSSSVLFRGLDGARYKSGFAPLQVEDQGEPEGGGKVVAVVGVDGAASLYEQLGELRRNLVLLGGAGVLAVVLLSVLLARRITRPVRQLVEAARAMGAGDLATPIVVGRPPPARPDAPRPAVVEATGDEIGFLAVTLEEMRRELSARDERLQMMLAGIAHEVRNPLAGMELFAGLLRDDLGGAGDEERLSQVRRIERELGHLRTIVSEFLDYARRPRPDLRDDDAAELVREVAQVLAADAAGRAGARVKVVAPERLPARFDPAQLRRALLNLGRNGLQALGEGGGTVTLGCEGDERTLRFTCADDGRGIAPEHLPRLFQPFFTTREQGTGLGLAFVAETARAHGGTVEVDAAPGRGAAFTIALPRSPAAPPG